MAYTIRGVAEETARIVAKLAEERTTGKITITIDMRDGGIGAAGVDIYRKMNQEK